MSKKHTLNERWKCTPTRNGTVLKKIPKQCNKRYLVKYLSGKKVIEYKLDTPPRALWKMFSKLMNSLIPAVWNVTTYLSYINITWSNNCHFLKSTFDHLYFLANNFWLHSYVLTHNHFCVVTLCTSTSTYIALDFCSHMYTPYNYTYMEYYKWHFLYKMYGPEVSY